VVVVVMMVMMVMMVVVKEEEERVVRGLASVSQRQANTYSHRDGETVSSGDTQE